MTAALAIARRELGAYFRLPVGWIVIALYTLLAGAVFALVVFQPGQPATMRTLFSISGWLLLPVAPAISMRLVSEELRSGTIEPLVSSPASELAIIIGKFVAACVFLVLMLAPTLLHAAVLYWAGRPSPDAGPLIAGYLNLVLIGAFYLGAGLFCSAMTANQTLAFLSTLFLLLGLLVASTLGVDRAPAWLAGPLAALSINARSADFAKGIIDTSNVVFFASGAAWFVVLAWIAIAARRWR